MTCAIDTSERGPVINAYLQAGRAPYWIEGQMKAMGAPTKAETVAKHLRVCLGGDASKVAILENAVSGDGRPGAEYSPNADFAAAIRAEANRLLAEGTLKVTAQHGLMAQQLLDRRAEKAADRRLLVQLAGLLSGSMSLEAGPPEDLIEGEFTEVSPLAPLALVSGGDPD